MPIAGTNTCHFDYQVGADHYYLSCQGEAYHCKADHRVANAHKGRWSIPRPDECHAFCSSTAEPAGSVDGDRWHFSHTPIGTARERLARFMAPGAAGASWHGFPVGGTRKRANEAFPSQAIVDEWLNNNVIDRATHSRIIRRSV